MLNRRAFLQNSAFMGMTSLLPAWAQSSEHGNHGMHHHAQTEFDLSVGRFPVRIDGKAGEAIGVNGTLPAPLIRFREGDEITLNVRNTLDEDTSIHWHGLLVPFQMDGVPGVTFPGIRAGETFTYKFSVPQNGTYWYHSHSGLQEQQGVYGPLIVDPKDHDPIAYDREYVLVLSDWSFENAYRIFDKLKKMSDNYNFQQRTIPDFLADIQKRGFNAAWADRAMWGGMRMSPRDIADVTGSTYHFLINGHSTADNWNGVFKTGERVRLRIINASAMTIFNVRMPDLPMTIVAADGLHVQPLEVDEFQMGVAETYDVIIEPKSDRAYAFVAESIDRSGQAVATFGPQPGMRAVAPALRAVPTLTMKDMGMDHSAMGHDMSSHDMMDHSAHEMTPVNHSNHAGMDHSNMSHDGMDHSNMNHHAMPIDHSAHAQKASWPVEKKDVVKGPGVANVNLMPISRLDEPGIGLEDAPHRVMRYSQLRSLARNPDLRAPEREIEIHLTSNMERYMWSFDGVRFSEVTEAIKFREGERVRVTLINSTMMPHPIHLHGMFFDLVNGGGDHSPRKHTVIVKPAEKLSFDVSAEHVGDWAFHCHLLYHMHAGMMQVVSVLPDPHKGHKMHDKAPVAADPHAHHQMPEQAQMDHSAHQGHDMMDHSSHQAPTPAPEPPPMDHSGHSMHNHHDMSGGAK